MTIENVHVTQEKQRQAAEIERGLQEGYDGAIKPLPPFYSQKTLVQLTAYERGHFVGRELFMSEQGDHA